MKPATICAAIAAQALLFTGAAKAEPPPCGEPAIIESLKNDARTIISRRRGPTGNALIDKLENILVPNGEFDVKISDMFTASRSEDARQCQATLHLVEPGRVDGTVTIAYTAIRTEDGKNVYTVPSGQDWASGLFDSLKANNNLQPSIDDVTREILRSANESSGVRNVMRAYPGLNTPPPSFQRRYRSHAGINRENCMCRMTNGLTRNGIDKGVTAG